MSYNQWDTAIAEAEAFVISQASRVATWLAPFVPAIFVFDSAQLYIANINTWKAVLIAAVVELLGISVVSNWLDTREYNRLFRDEQIGERPTVVMLTIYVLTVLCIVFGLKINPVGFTWLALVCLSLMSVWSAIAFVQRRQHRARMSDKTRDMSQVGADKAFDKELDKELRLARHRQQLARIEAETVTVSRAVSSRDGTDKKPMTKAERHDKLLAELGKLSVPDDIDIDKLSGLLDVSGRTIRRDMSQLAESGRLSLNGHVEANG